MAKVAGLSQNFYAHGYDISGDVGAIQGASSPRNTLEVTGIDKSAIERLLGLSSGMLDFNSFFNDVSLQEHAALKGLPTGNRVVTWAHGTSRGSVSAFMEALQTNYDFARSPDGSLRASVNALASGGRPLIWGNMLTAGKITHSSSTVASSSVSIDDAALTSNGIRAVAHFFDISSGTPTIVIQDSADDSSFATILSFAAVADGGEPTAEYKTATGTVRRYISVATTGTFSNLQLAVAYQRGTAGDDESLA